MSRARGRLLEGAMAAVLVLLPVTGCSSGSGQASDGGTEAPGSAGSAGSGGSSGSAGSAGLGGASGATDSGIEASLPVDAGDAAGTDGPGPLPPSVRDYVSAFCAAVRSCCGKASLGSAAMLASCESDLPQQSDVLLAVATGTVVPNESALAACAGALIQTAADCVAPSACNGLWLGTLGEGQSCASASECSAVAGPPVCLIVYDVDGGTPSTGVCRAALRGTLVDACTRSCSAGQDCAVTNITPDPNAPLALCYEEDALFCDLDTQQCAPLSSASAACDADEQCGVSGYCDSTCLARKPAGQACAFSAECSKIDSLVCTSGTCAPAPFVSDSVCGGDFH
jgi:hypothetical protein